MGALSTTWNPKYREPFEPLVPGVRFLPWNDLGAVAAALNDKTAAVMLEPVQGEGGVRPAPPAFLQGLRKLTQERGALLVLDEVQCGLGRTGKLFAYQHAGITPDILTLAKPLGGGLPMGAVLLREDLAPAIAVGDHGSTFGGNPVAAAASLAVLDRLETPGFVEGVARRGALLFAWPPEACARPSRGDRRGTGPRPHGGDRARGTRGPGGEGAARAWLPGHEGGGQRAPAPASPRGQAGGDQGLPGGPGRGAEGDGLKRKRTARGHEDGAMTDRQAGAWR